MARYGAYIGLSLFIHLLTGNVISKVAIPESKQELEPIRMIYAAMMLKNSQFGCIVGFNYSYPMLYIYEDGFRFHVNRNYTKDSDEVAFMLAHQKLLEKMKTRVDFELNIGVRYECQYHEHMVWCGIYYLVDYEPIVVASYLSKPDKENPRTMSYCPSCMSTRILGERGHKIKDIIPIRRSEWTLLRHFYDDYMAWYEYHKIFKKYSGPRELSVTIVVSETKQPIVMCIVKSFILIPFNITLAIPGFESASNESVSHDKGVVSSAHQIISFDEEIIVNCTVESRMGWIYYFRSLLKRSETNYNNITIYELPSDTGRRDREDTFGEVMTLNVEFEKDSKNLQRFPTRIKESPPSPPSTPKGTWDVELVTLIGFVVLCFIIIVVLSQRIRSPFQKRRRRLRRED